MRHGSRTDDLDGLAGQDMCQNWYGLSVYVLCVVPA